MNNEEKKLLIKDLCARLPYGVKVTWDGKHPVTVTPHIYCAITSENNIDSLPKLLLRPMSSMTEEEKKELEDKIDKDFKLAIIACKENDITKSTSGFYKIDWLNAYHFDFRGLIPKGLAIEAPEGMYN